MLKVKLTLRVLSLMQVEVLSLMQVLSLKLIWVSLF
jgi:hypothetical protein